MTAQGRSASEARAGCARAYAPARLAAPRHGAGGAPCLGEAPPPARPRPARARPPPTSGLREAPPLTGSSPSAPGEAWPQGVCPVSGGLTWDWSD